jgi:hypothetical protein
MRRTVLQGLAMGGGLAVSAAPLWAHPSPNPHVHAEEIVGLLVVTLLVVGMLALAGKRGR